MTAGSSRFRMRASGAIISERRASDRLRKAVYAFVADQLALSLDATPPGTYRQRGTSSLQRRFRTHFQDFCARYENMYAARLGPFRLPRISSAIERFLDPWAAAHRAASGGSLRGLHERHREDPVYQSRL